VHAVCLDRATKSVVVSIRGTSCLEDVITDLHLEYEEFELSLGDKTFKGNVHSGMMTSAKNISERIKQVVFDALERNPDYTLVVTGHSLGAGTSSMLCLLWKNDLDAIKREIEVYCYSPPATNSASFNKLLKQNVLSCSFGHDVVAKASMGTASDLAEMMVFMDEAEKSNKVNARYILTNYVTSSEFSPENVQIYKEIKAFVADGYYERLVPPGIMFQIFKKGMHDEFEHAAKHPQARVLEDSVAGIFIKSTYHQEIIFSPNLAADHSCVNLQYTLQRMWGIKHTLDFNDS
jgi:hypothetical protein